MLSPSACIIWEVIEYSMSLIWTSKMAYKLKAFISTKVYF